MDWYVVGFGLAIILAIETSKPAPIWRVAAKPAPAAQEAYATWQSEAEGGAAFAIGTDGAFGWSDNHPHVDAARRFAIAYCEAKSSGTCRVTDERDWGVLHPEIGQVVSPKLARQFEQFRSYPGAKAFALNEDGYYGYFYGAKTQMGAKQGAKAKCEQYKGGYPKGIPPQPCKVVYVGG